MTWKWYVYIIICEDGSYYTGKTSQPDQRWTQHLSRLGSTYTRIHVAKEMAYIEEHTDAEQARMREKQIKGWTRTKKEKLISGKWGPLN
jgi:putative endonuclease